jgi:hypothetical protein
MRIDDLALTPVGSSLFQDLILAAGAAAGLTKAASASTSAIVSAAVLDRPRLRRKAALARSYWTPMARRVFGGSVVPDEQAEPVPMIIPLVASMSAMWLASTVGIEKQDVFGRRLTGALWRTADGNARRR